MRGFIRFNKGVLKLPLWVQAFMILLVGANMVSPLFFWAHFEAKVVFGFFMASFGTMVLLTSIFGFVRLLGISHILWIPLIYFLWPALAEHAAETYFGLWLRFLIVLNTLALALDALDVTRYIRGDRQEMVEGL